MPTPTSGPDQQPHRVAVLITDGLVLMDMAAPVQLFGHTGRPRYEVVICTEQPGLVSTCAGITVHADRGLDALESADTIIVPGYHDAARRTPSRVVTDALRAAHRRGTRIASICVGAFTLAEAGLLDGRPATTHWIDAATLASRYPSIRVDPAVLYVDDGDILTSAGLAAGIDLCLHLVELDQGADVARDFARRTVVAFHRPGGQAQFMPPTAAEDDAEIGEISHQAMTSGDNPLGATTRWALTDLTRPLGVADLAAHAGMSLRTFNRRFHETHGTGPGQWLTGQRLRRAAQLLERTDLPVDQVAAAVGLSAESLRVQFRNRMALSPSAYRNNFRVSSA
ncbi:DJ-1/PfpI family protein [Gordonia sp. ABSL1-1]|uniref:GlxA family transcriptional regulator n=1 Tax=Gordonia sp. ABSL1-1 TaxID=3053923 RepID=UPI0025744779|nr:DJ-1/PfpI family protein [Gordonia sp. ABSL1-1]MDL9937545.1 DJ-1/PfpI family protein [Gordonia sp. ABSL1-1]